MKADKMEVKSDQNKEDKAGRKKGDNAGKRRITKSVTSRYAFIVTFIFEYL